MLKRTLVYQLAACPRSRGSMEKEIQPRKTEEITGWPDTGSEVDPIIETNLTVV
jgi:hypothetical protein